MDSIKVEAERAGDGKAVVRLRITDGPVTTAALMTGRQAHDLAIDLLNAEQGFDRCEAPHPFRGNCGAPAFAAPGYCATHAPEADDTPGGAA